MFYAPEQVALADRRRCPRHQARSLFMSAFRFFIAPPTSPGSKYAGPASKADGLEDLKKEVSGQPRSRAIILYCGCCPWDKCPNIRPAFAALHDMGFQNVKVLMIPENLKADWIDKGYLRPDKACGIALRASGLLISWVPPILDGNRVRDQIKSGVPAPCGARGVSRGTGARVGRDPRR